MTPAGTARAEDPLGQVIFLTKLAEAVPAASIHRQAIREKQQQTLPTPLGRMEFCIGLINMIGETPQSLLEAQHKGCSTKIKKELLI
ncbi:hypothetical protein CEH05_07855 [Halobacillus halophilus]|nr:hypothetical protein CEH05_07855 [Halobacillus halophilus]